MAWTAIFHSPLAWFRKPPKTDYEEVLADLSHEIDATQTNLVQIRARTRRASLILPFWATSVWLIWSIACYFLGQLKYDAWFAWTPIVVTPFLIFFARRIVKWWYKRIQGAEEKHLKDLQKQRRDKIDEIKKATKYDNLRKLLDKYDDEAKSGPASGPQTPVRAQPGNRPGQPASRPPLGSGVVGGQAVTPLTGPQPKGPLAVQTGQQQQLPSGMRNANPAVGSIRAPIVPLQRTWLDRMADAVLGADPAGGTLLGPEQKYALICSKCKKHNGLATKEEFNEIQYVCPNCGSFETRRPSSVPVSSPWKTATSADTPSSARVQPSRLSKESQSRTLTSGNGEGFSDSPPPASPLAANRRTSHDDDDEGDHEVVEGQAGTSTGETTLKKGLSRRSAAKGGMDLD